MADSEEDYIGNMWGWKVSFAGLFLILLLLGMAGYNYYVNGPSEIDYDALEEGSLFKTEINRDSI